MAQRIKLAEVARAYKAENRDRRRQPRHRLPVSGRAAHLLDIAAAIGVIEQRLGSSGAAELANGDLGTVGQHIDSA